jgi:phosphatidylglycerophosphate synthase
MLDARLRPWIDPALDRMARPLAARGITANLVTLTGFALGLAAIPALATHHDLVALALILANRLLDGLDGALARASGPSDFGGFLDIVCDFVFYAAVPFGFALADPAHAPAAAFLIFSFVGSGSAFLAYAILAAKRGAAEPTKRKTFHHLGGLTEGFETILCFALMCLFPGAFAWLAWIFGALCWITAATRVMAARQAFP